MEEKIRALKQKVNELEEKVRQREASLPAHSVRVHQIEELERLEEERDLAREQLQELLKQQG
ncbi:MAG: hypothetical protein JEZ02_01380 [Desulfatibacillum sp.]|nr:hypothetical protein [Desulfatibacillum sp.]